MSIWIGIDEAGYGPYLGPLVLAATAFRVPEGTDEDGFWELLREGVIRYTRRPGERVVVDDSKKVNRNGGLQALEENVLAFATLLGDLPDTVATLLNRFQMPVTEDPAIYPWYADLASHPVPLEATQARLVNLTQSLRILAGEGPCRFLGMRFIAVHPGEYNRMVSVTRNKAMVEFQKCGMLLQFAWERFGSEGLMVAIDRQGGRTHYLKLLDDAFPGARFTILEETPSRSTYRVEEGPRRALIVFKVKADESCLPVALSSMLAKYVREVCMSLFNRYWQRRLPDLESTSGYPNDAGRFISRIEALLDDTPGLREKTVRSR